MLLARSGNGSYFPRFIELDEDNNFLAPCGLHLCFYSTIKSFTSGLHWGLLLIYLRINELCPHSCWKAQAAIVLRLLCFGLFFNREGGFRGEIRLEAFPVILLYLFRIKEGQNRNKNCRKGLCCNTMNCLFVEGTVLSTIMCLSHKRNQVAV